MSASTKWLIGEIVLISVAMTVLGIGGYPLLLPYGWHVFLHVLGAVLFMGNIIVSALWMVIAEQSGDKAAMRFAAGALNWADVVFTAPGIFLLLVNGFILAYAAWDGLTQSWIISALMLFILSGVIWAVFLIPLQARLIALSSSADALPATFFSALRRWYVWGTVATITPLVSLFLMVFKPQLW
jgi:uncharacterized membrane protein